MLEKCKNCKNRILDEFLEQICSIDGEPIEKVKDCSYKKD